MCSLGWPWLLLSAIVLTAVLAQKPSLQILPKSRPIRKEVGSNFVLTCRPNGLDTKLISNLEWRDKNGRRIEATNQASPIYVQKLSTDSGAMLIFPGLTEQQAGTYSCHANFANTEPLSASIEVSTFVDVNFVDAPENQYPVAGTNSIIKCKVNGNPYPTIDWYKGDQAIGENTPKYFRREDGLYITNVTEQDDGIYKCSAVVPSTGVYKIRNIKVEVLVAPKITPMEPVSVIEGETATIKCSASGKPPPTYTWIKTDQRNDLSKTDRFDVKKLTGELIMNRVEFGDDGFYKCKAENPGGRDETTVKINVLVKPQIYELLNVTESVYNQTRIVCKVKGRPVPKVTFRKLSNPEPYRVGIQETDTRIVLEQETFEDKGEAYGTLIISNLSRNDDGLYQCIAENPTGAAYKNGHVTVWFKPTFNRTKNLPPVWSWDGRPGNLSCLPEAIPNATIVWRWNQVEISEENFANGKLQRNVFQVIGRSPQSFLIVRPYNQPSLFTKYECIARNALGEASIKVELKQGFVPGTINQARAQSITATTIKFSIVPPSNYDGLPIRSFSVQYKPERVLSWDTAAMHTWSNGAPYILENLSPEVTYHFRFAARNDVGLGPWTNAETITMPQRSKPAEPRILLPTSLERSSNGDEVISPYSNHFELRWNVPADNGEPIDYYDIKHCTMENINGEYREKECTENMPQSVQYTTYQLDYLLPDTVYRVELRAHNAMGYSTPAQLYVRTARGVGPVIPAGTPMMSSTMIIGIVVGAILLILIVVDMTCFLVNRTGLIALCCDRSKKKADDEESKLGSYKAAPAHPNSLNLPQPIKLTGTPTEEKEPLKPEEKPTSVEYDGRQVYTKTGEIIGKNSAV
ncbi:neural cell adhesion molecule fasciclin 2 isoform X2 [Rhynchophorus ferrugineus]|uniref:neural cell adhesion molecule fasciclin 2 isoform X2 n=1 Tax=Rhynchophorus ferrugineus TaxID=354439 RepID=UPI003FCE3D39